MQNPIKHLSGTLLLLLLASCAVPPPPDITTPAPVSKKVEPIIRVGLIQGVSPIEFTTDNHCQLFDNDGRLIARGNNNRWSVEKVSASPIRTVYRLVAASMSSMERAQKKIEELKKRGFDSFVLPTGQSLQIGGRTVKNNGTFRVCLNTGFETEETAKTYQNKIRQQLETFVVSQNSENSTAQIILRNLQTDRQYDFSKPVYIKGGNVTICDVPVGTGFHWAHKETRTYPEAICFQLDNKGQLTVVNILPVETYLMGVVPSEMPEGFPLEALKAQAVAARGEALAKHGIVHMDDPFDICADVHCQVYSGLSKWSDLSNKAVKQTAGLVMMKQGKICNAVYASVCGGHTEDNNNTWGGNSESYLEGCPDGPNRLKWYGSLDNERNVKKWIDDKPEAYCNISKNGSLPCMEYTKKYFRWEEKFTQSEIRESIRQYTGKDFGYILDLIPVKRGKSGRIVKLKIIGSQGNIIIERELNIRRALSLTTLWSSCFYVKKERGRTPYPSLFVLKGAGFGHGVGMCQTGAAVMALKGYPFHLILKHYYNGVHIKRLY